MQLVEVRALDGPNLFALEPMLKVELVLEPGEQVADAARAKIADQFDVRVPADPLDAIESIVRSIHTQLELPEPSFGRMTLDSPGHETIFFPWQWRESALRIGRVAAAALNGQIDDDWLSRIRNLLEQDREANDQPSWITDEQRVVKAFGITGTNGKTTTTRMIAHVVRSAGYSAGWTSTAGVYVNGEMVLEGDYTGPAGAARVLEEPGLDYAVLETARGGILLRGLAYESNDVGVFLNVSADHLDMHGVETLETLTKVKSVVVEVTRPGGVVVLNADDERVLGISDRVRARIVLISRNPQSPAVAQHVAAGGEAMVSDGERIIRHRGSQAEKFLVLADIPSTYNGAALHMVENGLAAMAAALGMGFSDDQVREGMRTFRSDLHTNAGRLNLFKLNGKTIIVDYAHNEQGLEMLLGFARRLVGDEQEIGVIIGTAGDRQDSQLRGLGTIAAERADRVYLKETGKYLRGRDNGDVTRLMREGVETSTHPERLCGEFDGERSAMLQALTDSAEGDVIAIMCLEEQLAVLRELRDQGAEEW